MFLFRSPFEHMNLPFPHSPLPEELLGMGDAPLYTPKMSIQKFKKKLL